MKQIFPLNFFGSVLSPKKILKNRAEYGLGKLVLIFIFLNSLLIVPLILNINHQSLNVYYESISSKVPTLSKGTSKKIRELNFSNNQLDTPDRKIFFQNEHTVIGTNLSESDTKEGRTQISFNKAEWVLAVNDEEKRQTIKNTYTDNFGAIKTSSDTEKFLKTNLIEINYFSILLSMVFSFLIILTMMTLLLISGVSIFLYFTKKVSVISSLKECFSISLSAMSGGVILASLIGLINSDIFLMIGIQSIWMIMILMLILIKTKYQFKTAI